MQRLTYEKQRTKRRTSRRGGQKHRVVLWPGALDAQSLESLAQVDTHVGGSWTVHAGSWWTAPAGPGPARPPTFRRSRSSCSGAGPAGPAGQRLYRTLTPMEELGGQGCSGPGPRGACMPDWDTQRLWPRRLALRMARKLELSQTWKDAVCAHVCALLLTAFSSNPDSHPNQEVTSSFPFYRQEHWGLEELNENHTTVNR